MREGKGFIGSVSLPDIVHHIYKGDSHRLFPTDRPYRSVLYVTNTPLREIFSIFFSAPLIFYENF